MLREESSADTPFQTQLVLIAEEILIADMLEAVNQVESAILLPSSVILVMLLAVRVQPLATTQA